TSHLLPYTTLFRSQGGVGPQLPRQFDPVLAGERGIGALAGILDQGREHLRVVRVVVDDEDGFCRPSRARRGRDPFDSRDDAFVRHAREADLEDVASTFSRLAPNLASP